MSIESSITDPSEKLLSSEDGTYCNRLRGEALNRNVGYQVAIAGVVIFPGFGDRHDGSLPGFVLQLSHEKLNELMAAGDFTKKEMADNQLYFVEEYGVWTWTERGVICIDGCVWVQSLSFANKLATLCGQDSIWDWATGTARQVNA